MNIVPFDSGKVPAVITSMFGGDTNKLVGNSGGGGFPVISIKGKVFHIQRGDERTLVTKPGEDDPAASIEVVVVNANPNNSKVFYAEGYQEGEKAKPTCYSNSGVVPESNAQEPQSTKCATCAHNQWGSRVTPDGRKAKACQDTRRLAIATLDTPNDPMLIRVPAGSLKALVEYGKILAARGVPPEAVVTKIGFDYSVAHPALTFKPVGLIGDAEHLAAIKAASSTDIVAEIIGLKVAVDKADDDTPAPAPAAAAPAPAVPKPAPKPAAPKPAAVESAAVAPKKANVTVETPAAPAAEVSGTAALESQIGSMMDDMNFDD
jgi:hypothetical protein